MPVLSNMGKLCIQQRDWLYVKELGEVALIYSATEWPEGIRSNHNRSL